MSSFQDGVDVAAQFDQRYVAGAILVCFLKESIQVGGGAKKSDEFLLAVDAIGIGHASTRPKQISWNQSTLLE